MSWRGPDGPPRAERLTARWLLVGSALLALLLILAYALGLGLGQVMGGLLLLLCPLLHFASGGGHGGHGSGPESAPEHSPAARTPHPPDQQA